MNTFRSLVGVAAWGCVLSAGAFAVLEWAEWRYSAAGAIWLTGIWLTLYGMTREAPKVGEAK